MRKTTLALALSLVVFGTISDAATQRPGAGRTIGLRTPSTTEMLDIARRSPDELARLLVTVLPQPEALSVDGTAPGCDTQRVHIMVFPHPPGTGGGSVIVSVNSSAATADAQARQGELDCDPGRILDRIMGEFGMK
jgi:hypothetical protein